MYMYVYVCAGVRAGRGAAGLLLHVLFVRGRRLVRLSVHVDLLQIDTYNHTYTSEGMYFLVDYFIYFMNIILIIDYKSSSSDL